MSANSASRKLYKNEIKDFEEAMIVYVAQHQYEYDLCKHSAPHPPEYMESPRKQAHQALGIYRKHLEAARIAAIEELRQCKLDAFAQALAIGQYSELAL